MGDSAIDVIVPVFNGEMFIVEALKSVQQQTRPVARIIVADDGSTDGTERTVASLMDSDHRITYLKLSHSGVSIARNAGIAASSSPFVAFLDADDVWLPEKLEQQMHVFERCGPEIGFVHSSYFFINAKGKRLSDHNVVPPQQSGDIFRQLLLEGYVLSGSASSVVVRRDVLDQAGHFDERLFHGEDWDLWIRLAHISKVDYASGAVVGIRVHDQSAQRRPQADREILFFNQQLLVYSKWEELIGEDKRFRESLRKRAYNLALPLLREPVKAHLFYRSLAMSDSAIVRSVLPSSVQFWFNMAAGVLRIAWRRVRRMAGIDG